jgi:hypothetical protein
MMKYAILVFLSLMITGALSNIFNSTSHCTIASLSAAMTAYANPSQTLCSAPASILLTLITTTTRHPTSLVPPVADSNVSLNMAKEKAEAYTCERAQRESSEFHNRRCGHFSAIFHFHCYLGTPWNCCRGGKGPTTCLCHYWWPKDAPRTLKTGMGPPDGTKCLINS